MDLLHGVDLAVIGELKVIADMSTVLEGDFEGVVGGELHPCLR